MLHNKQEENFQKETYCLEFYKQKSKYLLLNYLDGELIGLVVADLDL